MIESILPTLSGGLLGSPASASGRKKAGDDDVPKTVTVRDLPPEEKKEEQRTEEADAADPATPPTSRMLECDYDLNPSELYQAIEAKQWDYAVSLYTKTTDDKATDENGDELVAGSVEEQSRTWVVRKESNGKLRWRLLPLHAGIIFGAPVKLIELMLQSYPHGAHHKDDQGMLPLHLAFRNEASWEIIEELLTAHPQAINVKDRKGRTPLQCGMRSVSSAISIASANNSLSNKQPLTPEQQKAMRTHLAFRNVVNIIELWAQIAVSGERQRGIQESRAALESRIGQMQESHLSTLTTLKREWQAQQEEASKQVQDLHEANMTLQGQLHEAGHALQVAKAHYQELQEELSMAKIELIRREEAMNIAEAEKNAAIDGYHRTVDEYQKKEAEYHATAVPDTYVVADELHHSESMRHQQHLEFEQQKHELSLKQLQITSVANRQISAYQNTNRVLRRNIDDLVDQLELAQGRFSDLLNKYQSMREERAQLVRNFQRQTLAQTEQELATLENARTWLADSKRRLQDQQISLSEEKKVEDTLDYVERTSLNLSQHLDRLQSPNGATSYQMPIDTTGFATPSVVEGQVPTVQSYEPEVASPRPPPAEYAADVPPPLDTVPDEPIAVESKDDDEDMDAKFAAGMGTILTQGGDDRFKYLEDTNQSMDDPAAPASSPIYASYARKYGSGGSIDIPKLTKAGSNDDMAAPATLPIVPAYDVNASVIDLSNVSSPKSTA